MIAPALIYLFSTIMIYGTLFLFMVRRLFTAPLFYLALSFYYLVPSAFLYILGVEELTSDLHGFDAEPTLILQGIIIALFSIFLAIGYLFFGKRNLFDYTLPYYDDNRSHFLMFTGIGLLSLGSLAVAGSAIIFGGGIFSAIDLIRHEGFLTGFNFLRQFIRLGTLLSAAYFISLMVKYRKTKTVDYKMMAIYALGFFLLNIFCAFILGGKNFIIFPLIIFVVSYAVFLTKRPVKNLIAPTVLLALLLIGLQYNRTVNVKQGEFNLEYETFSGVGLTTLDLNQIFLQELTDSQATSIGEDFYYGFLGIVPRSIWPDKPDQITAGGRFKQQITNRSDTGGWPPFGFNQWYANFGWIGVCIGGVLSGMMLRGIANRYRDCYTNPFSMALMIYFVILFLIPGGIENKIFIKYVQDVIPLFIFRWLSDRRYVLPHNILRKPGGSQI